MGGWLWLLGGECFDRIAITLQILACLTSWARARCVFVVGSLCVRLGVCVDTLNVAMLPESIVMAMHMALLLLPGSWPAKPVVRAVPATALACQTKKGLAAVRAWGQGPGRPHALHTFEWPHYP